LWCNHQQKGTTEKQKVFGEGKRIKTYLLEIFPLERSFYQCTSYLAVKAKGIATL
jgi:hypothetical protein